ncbi:hypothetical protein Asp14428_75780 [Actinoplanes sp. NBRC 14428]|nr:hypothetical protein Asp14428_75780 [Actinoplanes sp. NBRC 14428]
MSSVASRSSSCGEISPGTVHLRRRSRGPGRPPTLADGRRPADPLNGRTAEGCPAASYRAGRPVPREHAGDAGSRYKWADTPKATGSGRPGTPSVAGRPPVAK